MTATITERPLSTLRVGDQVECLRMGRWEPATVEEAPCGCHVDVKFADAARTNRYATTPDTGGEARIRWPQQPQLPVYDIDTSLALTERLRAFDASGIRSRDRVKVTLLSRPRSGSAMQQSEYSGDTVWTFASVDRRDAERTFLLDGQVGGEPVQRWVADIAPWHEPEDVSHGETAPEWPTVGEHVQFEHAGAMVYGVVDDIPVDRTNPDMRFCVRTVNHGRLYPRLDDMFQPDPLEWAQALHSDDPVVARQINAITEAQARIDATASAKAEFLNLVQEVASRTANDEEWCEVADSGLAKLGLTRVRAIEDVGWSVDVRVTLERELDEDDVAEMLADHFDVGEYDEVSANSVSITGTADITVSGTCYEVEEGSCVCDGIDRFEIREQMPTWARDLSFDYDEVTCDNDN